MNNIPKMKIGIVAVSRDCFPIQLSEKRRAAIKETYKGELYECPVTVENEKDIVVYQDILNSIEKNLPKKIGSKEIVQVFTDPKIMPYLEDELFCRKLEDIFLSRKLKYIKNFRDPIYMYLGKYDMSKLSNAMDYSNVPLYKRPAFVAFIVISVILLEVIFGIV